MLRIVTPFRALLGASALIISTWTAAPSFAATNPVPFLEQPLKPSGVAPGASAFTLTVSGTGFIPQSQVLWNGTPLPTRLATAHRLTAKVQSAYLQQPGTAIVTVLNPAPGGGSSVPAFFEITKATPSVISFPMRVPTPSPTSSAVTADFNGDGILDIATSTGSTLTLLSGKGDGTFSLSTISTAATSIGTLVAGDFDGNGTVDLAFPDPTSNLVHVLLGHGDGTFQEISTATVGRYPGWALAADFNGDGHLDLVTTNHGSRSVSVLLGKGDGTFTRAKDIPVGKRPTSLVAADFNSDGYLDLAVVDAGDDVVAIFSGQGDGSFKAMGSLATGAEPYQVVATDFNRDGKVDLAVSNSCGNAPSCSSHAYGSISIFLGAGDGSFHLVSQPETNYHDSLGLAAADFNGDGKPDLAIVNRGEYNSEILLGNGDGTFHGILETYSKTGPSPRNIIVGDFNNDGRLDYAVTAESGLGGFVGLATVLQSPVAFYPDILQFAPQTVGTESQPKDVFVTNLGTAPIHISQAGAELYFTETDDCAGTLNGGSTCTIKVTFSPIFKGATGGIVYIKDDAFGSLQQGYLEGVGK